MYYSSHVKYRRESKVKLGTVVTVSFKVNVNNISVFISPTDSECNIISTTEYYLNYLCGFKLIFLVILSRCSSNIWQCRLNIFEKVTSTLSPSKGGLLQGALGGGGLI